MPDKIPMIFVSGADGQLAKEIRFLSKERRGIQIKFFNKEDLDITDKKDLKKSLNKYNPDFFINCAAYTAVDKAEKDSKKAYQVNSIGAKNVAKACRKHDCTLIHISTDYVYNNSLRRPLKETDPCEPKGVYAKSKYEGEQNILSEWQKSIIIRSSWIYSSYGSNFVKTINSLLTTKNSINIVDDQYGSPTYARDLARAILDKVIEKLKTDSDLQLYGIYNYSNSGTVNWYDFALEIKKISGQSCNIKGIASKEYNAPAPRPSYSVLDKSKIMDVFAIADIPNWKDSLVVCMTELNN
jgi:dTDP-4-dehydrorhamnose reductase